MTNFRKRPVLVTARQFTASTLYDVLGWIRTQGGTATEAADALGPVLVIRTLEGSMTAHPGDWIVRGVRGEFHPVRGDIFAETYEPVGAGPAAPAADQAPLRDRIAEALANADGLELGETESFPFLHEGQVAGYRRRADAVLSVLPAPADRAAILTEAADAVFALDYDVMVGEEGDENLGSMREAWDLGTIHADKLLRRLAAEAAGSVVGVAADATPAETRDEEIALLRLTPNAVEEGRRELRGELARIRAQMWTLTAMLEGLHTLIATSSRDWGVYRVDAWLWAVLAGWDCEQDEHDGTCTHGAMEEMQQRHGWSDEAVAKARRYRAAVRALTASATVSGPVVPAQPADGTGRRVYAWAQTIDTADGGRTVHIPGTHHSGHGPETTAIVVSREDVPTLRAMLVDAAETGDESDYPRDPDAEEILNALPPEAQRSIRAQLAAEARQDGAQPS